MTFPDLLLLVIIAAGAAYAGYLFGRQSVLNEQRHQPDIRADIDPLPGPSDALDPPRRSSAPPPASAGGEPMSHGSATGAGTGAPRRSSTPPPARAGLLDTGTGKDPKKG